MLTSDRTTCASQLPTVHDITRNSNSLYRRVKAIWLKCDFIKKQREPYCIHSVTYNYIVLTQYWSIFLLSHPCGSDFKLGYCVSFVILFLKTF